MVSCDWDVIGNAAGNIFMVCPAQPCVPTHTHLGLICRNTQVLRSDACLGGTQRLCLTDGGTTQDFHNELRLARTGMSDTSMAECVRGELLVVWDKAD